MAKKVFIYGDRVINERIPDSEDKMSMLAQMKREITKRQKRQKRLNQLQKTKQRDASSNRGTAARRAKFQARVLIHKNQRNQKGIAVNVSQSGIFVNVERGLFKLEEAVNLLIKPSNSRASYRVIARVKRFGKGSNGRSGYGLEFIRPQQITQA